MNVDVRPGQHTFCGFPSSSFSVPAPPRARNEGCSTAHASATVSPYPSLGAFSSLSRSSGRLERGPLRHAIGGDTVGEGSCAINIHAIRQTLWGRRQTSSSSSRLHALKLADLDRHGAGWLRLRRRRERRVVPVEHLHVAVDTDRALGDTRRAATPKRTYRWWTHRAFGRTSCSTRPPNATSRHTTPRAACPRAARATYPASTMSPPSTGACNPAVWPASPPPGTRYAADGSVSVNAQNSVTLNSEQLRQLTSSRVVSPTNVPRRSGSRCRCQSSVSRRRTRGVLRAAA